jgi:glycogen debranching enzyme
VSIQPEVRVGSQNLTVYQGTTVLVTNGAGEIRTGAEQGLFLQDTRFLSTYDLLINGVKWDLVQSTPLRSYCHRLYFTNPELGVLDQESIAPHSLGLRLDRKIGGGLHEDLTLTNYSGHAASLRLRIRLDSDFADIFDVKAHRFVSRGVRDSVWNSDERELRIFYSNNNFRRELIFKIVNSKPTPHFSNGQILFEIILAPGEVWHTCNLFTMVVDGVAHPPLYPCELEDLPHKHIAHEFLHDNWTARTTSLSTPDYRVGAMYRQAVDDIGGLRIHEYDFGEDMWVPAAGVPWFVTLFGRDSLTVAYQAMMVSQTLAPGPLAKLAQFQATAVDDYRDAEPGKIMHEVRHGELAHLHKIPHTPYYGTADATILYLIVLSEYFRWTADRSILERLRETALRCLSWIDNYGDRDGDGFQEYQRRSPTGYYNQSWKDAGDAILYPDGHRLVALPIATCELQGYVYDAKLRMAEAFEALGDTRQPDRLRRQAQQLRDAFNQHFWLPQEKFLALCLDGNKQAVATIASNPGHCLWSGIVEPQAARAVASRLFEEDMWSGWGVRTMSAAHPAYNPLEYQRGSVWPHDNGFIAAGLARYGFRAAANRIAEAIFDAASAFEHLRLPELFAGFARTRDPYPVQYPQANVPQAWASGSIFHLLRTVLGLNADAPHQRLYVDPVLPQRLQELTLSNLSVGQARVSLRFEHKAGRSGFEVLECSDSKLKIEAGAPRWYQPGE